MRILFLILTLCVCSVSGYAQDDKALFWDTTIVKRYKINYYDDGWMPALPLNNDVELYLRQSSLMKSPFENNDNKIDITISFKLNNSKINTNYNVYDSLAKAYIIPITKDTNYMYIKDFQNLPHKKVTKIKNEKLVVIYTKNNKIYSTRVPLELLYYLSVHTPAIEPHNDPSEEEENYIRNQSK